MATLSYTLYDYIDVPPGLVEVDPNVATSDAIFVLSTNGPFPNAWWLGEDGEWEGGELDGSLQVSIDGIDIGRAFFGPPGADTTGYFQPTDGSLSQVTAIIPRDVWRSIIADGHLQVQYQFGLDAEALARPDDFIRTDINWLESYNGVRGSPEADTIVVNMPTIIEGRGGDDIITGSDQGDIIMGGTGSDMVDGGGGPDRVRGDDGNDTMFGADGEDKLSGGTGNDEVSGGGGDDYVLGGAGNDALFGDTGNDRVHGDAGIDNLSGGVGDDFLWGGDDKDWLYGDAGADRLRGDAGNDNLDGGDGNDYLWGGAGDDKLVGGHGENHLFGGDGADSFIFSAAQGQERQHVYDFDRGQGDQLVYLQDFDEVVDSVDIRDGKDGSVITIGDLSIVVSGVHDLTVADITFGWNPEFPFI